MSKIKIAMGFFAYCSLFQLILYTRICRYITVIKFKANSVEFSKFYSVGVPQIQIHRTASCHFGPGLQMVNCARYATLGKPNRCKILVTAGSRLSIGRSVGMSNATLVATVGITIGDNVLIGGGVTIADTDFHSLNPAHWNTPEDVIYMKRYPIKIGDDVFIGMDSLILKGVVVGSRAVIAAGSVVTKSVPPGEIWGGNPAVCIRRRADH